MIYVENVCRYTVLIPNIRLEPFMYACLLHVNTENPFLYTVFFKVDSFGIPFCHIVVIL